MNIYIVASSRTPIGSFLGGLSNIPAPELGSYAVKDCLKKSGLSPEEIDQLIAGNVLNGGLGQNPAKQCSLKSELPSTCICTLVNKVCCSSLKALCLAAQSIKCGDSRSAVVVGFENMSRAPHIVYDARKIKKMGNIKFEGEAAGVDLMITDGLWDSFSNKHMGSLVDKIAAGKQISREEQDRYAIQSFKRAVDGWETGMLDVTPVGEIVKDENITKLIPEKVPTLRPCFNQDGTLTAANSSSLADGAAAMIVVSDDFMNQHQLKPIARIVSYADYEMDPADFPLAVPHAARKALEKANLQVADIDLWEINEAFAAVTLAFTKELQISEDIVNILGGAIAIGHPLGCTGLRIVNSLISALKVKGKKLGLAALCNGGGGATAVIIELV